MVACFLLRLKFSCNRVVLSVALNESYLASELFSDRRAVDETRFEVHLLLNALSLTSSHVDASSLRGAADQPRLLLHGFLVDWTFYAVLSHSALAPSPARLFIKQRRPANSKQDPPGRHELASGEEVLRLWSALDHALQRLLASQNSCVLLLEGAPETRKSSAQAASTLRRVELC